MPGTVKPVPDGHHTVTPYLTIKNAAHALEFYERAFGATETSRLTMPDDRRPRLHFTPRRNWLNDPNGLVHHAGVWHLFFQHNPNGDHWADMSWGHAVSTDLVTWDERPVAIRGAVDDHGNPTELVFSGSAVVEGDDLVAVYTSVAPEPWSIAASAQRKPVDLSCFPDPASTVCDPNACGIGCENGATPNSARASA